MSKYLYGGEKESATFEEQDILVSELNKVLSLNRWEKTYSVCFYRTGATFTNMV